jgi:hypothetical protein
MKKLIFVIAFFAAALAALSLAACAVPLETPSEGGGKTGRVVISIAGGLSTAEAAENAALINRSLLPEYGLLTYTVEITKDWETTPVFTQTVTETSTVVDLESGSYTVLVEARNSDDMLVAEGSGTVSVSAGAESIVTVKLAALESGTGTFEYTVVLPAYPPVQSGAIEFFRLSGGANPPSVNLTGGLTGTTSLPAGYYRAVLRVEVLGKRVAKTLIVHIAPDTLTGTEFNLSIGDFVPSPPAGGSVIYISTQAELAAINDHIASAAMNYGKNAYVLLGDINLVGTWTPIGNISATGYSLSAANLSGAFQGRFFGDNHRITGLGFSEGDSTRRGRGLFGAVYKALIQDLYVETKNITISLSGMDWFRPIGILAGYANDSDLENITVKAANFTVDGLSLTTETIPGIGGAFGLAVNSRLKGISVTPAVGAALSVSINGTFAVTLSVGGIAGGGTGSVIRKSGYFGTLTASGGYGTLNIGGITGEGGTIEECYVMADINVPSSQTLLAGGIAGSASLIRNCYAYCRIDVISTSAYHFIGGILGRAYNNAVEKSYAAGSLKLSGTGVRPVGGIAGGGNVSETPFRISSSASLMKSLTTNDSILAGRIGMARNLDGSPNTDISGLQGNIAFNGMFVNGFTVADALSSPENDANGLGKTAAQLKIQSTYETGLGWDFATVWEMGPSSYPYPVLKWQNAIPVPPAFEILEDEGFATGVGFRLEEQIDLDATTQTIYKTGNVRPLTITAPAGYDAYRWLVDGKTAGTAQSFSMNPVHYTLGAHTVTAIVYRGAVPYSKNIVITVSWQPGDVLEFTSLSDMADTLAALPQNSALDPYPVKLSGLDISSDFTALSGRYVDLDLSACTGTSIGSSAFRGCSSLVSIKLPASLTSIGSSAFNGCTSLVYVVLPSGLTTIGRDAFRGCGSLVSIELPDSLTSIGAYVFYGCSSLVSIELPAGLTSILPYVFYGCSSLTSVICRAVTPPATGDNILPTPYPSIRVPAASVDAYKTAAGWSAYADMISAIN